MYPSAAALNSSVDGDTPSQQTTPPLFFTTQFAGSPRTNHGNSPSLELLQMANYSAVVGGQDAGLSSPSRALKNSGVHIHASTGDSPINVTLRTRDGRRSPLMSNPMGDVTMEVDFTRGNPYGYSISGRSTPVQSVSPVFPPRTPSFQTPCDLADGHPQGHCNSQDCPSTAPGSPGVSGPAGSLSATGRAELPSSVVHRALAGRCRFVPFPASVTDPENSPVKPRPPPGPMGGAGSAPDPRSQQALFIGQVRFETTPAELIWLVHRTSGACASHTDSRGSGCYLLYCKSLADLQLVRSLHKRVLFDIGGVWLARTAEEVDALCEYIALDAPLIARRSRLPRDSMVVEELRPDALPPPPQQQQQQLQPSGDSYSGDRVSDGGPAPPQYVSFPGAGMPNQRQQQQQRGPPPPGYAGGRGNSSRGFGGHGQSPNRGAGRGRGGGAGGRGAPPVGSAGPPPPPPPPPPPYQM